MTTTPQHPRWKEFRDRLEGPGGCNFTQSDPAEDAGTIRWDCNHDLAFARAILEDMVGVDVEASISFFEANGGFCDCEILFNVDPAEDNDE